MLADLQIVGSGHSYVITQGGKVLARATSTGNAIARLRGVEARLRPVFIRQCIACPTHFKSTGKGNRLCPICTRDA